MSRWSGVSPTSPRGSYGETGPSGIWALQNKHPCYLRQGGYVLPGVCLSVCLSVNYWSDHHSNFVRDASVDMENWLNFGWKSSVSGFGDKNFWRIIQYCETWHFSRIWLISLEKLTGSAWRFYCSCIGTRTTPLNFRSYPNCEFYLFI